MKISKDFKALTKEDFKKITSLEYAVMRLNYQKKINGKWKKCFESDISGETGRFIKERIRIPKVINNILSLTAFTIDLDRELLEILIKIRDLNLYNSLRRDADDERLKNSNISWFPGLYEGLFEYYELFNKLQKYKVPEEIKDLKIV